MIKSKNKIILVCTECLSRNYTISKSAISHNERLSIKKYCANCNGHILHKETR